MAANPLRYGFTDLPIALLAQPPGTGWTTVSTQQDPSSTNLVYTSASGFPTSVEFDIIVGLKNADGTWSNAERQLVTDASGSPWVVVRGDASKTHAVGESIYHELSATALLNNPGARTTTGDIDYLASTGRLARLAIGADGTVLQVASGLPTWATPTGTGAPVLATSPVLVTPTLGVASGTSLSLSSYLFVSNGTTSGNFIAAGATASLQNNSVVQMGWNTGGIYVRKLLFDYDNGDVVVQRAAAATLQLGDNTNGAAVNQSLLGCNGITGTDRTGANVTFGSGKGTGAGGISSVFIQTPTALASGTTAQTLTTRLTIDVNGIKATGYLSSDGSAGVSAGPYTTITSITVKNGLVTSLSGA